MPLDPLWIQEGLLYGGLLGGALLDLLTRRISNLASLGFLTAGLLAQTAAQGGSGLLHGLAGAGTGLLLLLLPFALRLVKGGDVKFLAAMGAWLGPLPTISATICGFVAAGVLSAALLVAWPSLRGEVLANLRAVMLGAGLPPATVEQRPRHQTVPLGAALAVGGVFTRLLGWGA
ncbi:MAG: hypothetical protein FJ125_09295 [Deltaproteobacteria bacterium]|nr:hypothetical protein [Deltaproteobacteria bacterium]